MMKNQTALLVLIAAIVALTGSVQADVINCYDNHDPYYSSSYDMEKRVFTSNIGEVGDGIDVEGESVRVTNATFKIKGRGKFEIVDQKGKVLQKLDLNFKGTDSTSDRAFPYTGKASDYQYSLGCESTSLKAKVIE
jgi:hypothetical protein